MDEPSTLLTAGGLGIIGATVALLIWNKVSPIVAMVLIPIVGALLLGFSITDIAEFAGEGLSTVMNVTVMFIFAILFFGILYDAGLFDPVIRSLILATRGKIILVTVGTGLIGAVAHLDGAGATTFLLTVPALLPLYQALNMSKYLLLLMLALAASIMNLVPWGGPAGRVVAVTGEEPLDIYLPLIPLQGVGVVLLIILGVLLGMRESRRIQKQVAAGEIQLAEDFSIRSIADNFSERQLRERADIVSQMRSGKAIYWTNAILALTIFGLMLADVLPPHLAFMIGVAIALPLNFSSSKLQMERIRAHAPNALMMAAVILGASVFLGVLDQSKMLESIALSALAVIPEGLGPNLHIAMGVLGVPMDLLTSTDAYYFSVLPLVEATATQYGVSSIETAHAMMVGNVIGTFVSPFSPAVWLMLGLANANFGQHLKYSFFIVWGFSVLMLLAAMALGLVGIS
ncbi:CitMHS family transporter [Auritidibacter ignavus]|uniref:Citrate:proton symporter n=1 Tax=Auritidibacter ignavus TaxID=678932 RepID=A0AAJ6AG32_9MICC|nr:citrate:proton symporter [Auritidibacter ignavus]NIH72620.1 CitMHS family citrate-Mg2+:H+ or citrate-Ca2+:H+ symporter [Auritidibacter ignavus]RMX23162.1 citrate transporter [Auritidibacter ignavus]WGH83179.1 citrate:proton symporter [Auritidibacter ignavus]WGH92703.1 citrate:proton symporter [Auritidibacter ignavus]